MKKVALIAIAMVMAVALTGCFGSHKGSAVLVGIRFTDSIGSGGKAHGCIEAGQHITTTDSVYWLPATQNIRQDDWDTHNAKADHNDLIATTKDGVQVSVQANLNFGMVGSCDQLTKFAQTIGITRDAFFNSDASYKDGWITAMNYYVSGNTESRIRDAISQYNADQIWPGHQVWSQIISSVLGSGTNSLVDNIKTSTNGEEYYTVSALQINNIQPAAAYTKTIQDRQTAKTEAQTAALNAQTQVKQAQAQAKIARANAKVNRATIAGWPSVDAYLKSLVIKSGGNPFQPSGALITPGQ